MKYHIWRQLIQILSFRNDLINTMKPFFEELTNNINHEKFNINEEQYLPFLSSFSSFQLEVLYKIINNEKESSNNNEEILSIIKTLSESNNNKNIEEIIEGDKLEELQDLIREKDIKTISPITSSFNEVGKITIPIIIFSIIKKATKCFKYLLINGIEDPTVTMQVQSSGFYKKPYEWDCMSIAIYYGEMEIMKILEEKGIEKGNTSAHIEAAILSYRHGIAKEIINQMNEKNENETLKEDILYMGLITSIKNNNINGAELLINNGTELLISNGANIKERDIIYQIKLYYF